MLLAPTLKAEHDYAVTGGAGWHQADAFPAMVAGMAVGALIAEASLTPKPGLVDARGSGAHSDLDLDLMHRSARSLFPCFEEMAFAVKGQLPSQKVRETLARIGRDGETAMFEATGGVNTHKGAIWALGLLVAGSAMCVHSLDPIKIASVAGAIARYEDTRVSATATNGSKVVQRYGVPGARGEAQDGFPHVVKAGLPTLRNARLMGVPEVNAKLDALLAIMAELDDTCLLHRGGPSALETAKTGAANILQLGGTSTDEGRIGLAQLDSKLLELNVSPGGSGDLFAATLFLDSLTQPPAGASAGTEHGVFQTWKY